MLAKKYLFCFDTTMKSNSITFTSKIKFVDRKFYNALEKHNEIKYQHNCSNILKADEFYSEDIRTCTGGGLVKPFEEAEGFHFWNDLPNIKNFPENINKLFRYVRNPERGLLVGSKDLKGSPYSVEMFAKFKKVFLDRIKNVTLFEKHRYTNSGTNYHYSKKYDTWTLYTTFRRENEAGLQTIKTLNDLLECFENISIAKGDRLFIGKKEILPKDCPEIFAKE